MSRRDRDRDSDCKVYVGDLSSSTTKQDLEEAFRAYGPLKNVWVARHPPGFAFIEFDDARDADDSVRGLDGRSICGRRVRVEPSNAGRRRGGRGPPPRRSRPYHPEDKCYQCGERGHYARDCTQYDRRGRSRRTRSSSRSRSRDRRSRSRGGDSRSRSRSRTKKSRSRDRQRSRQRSAERPRSESSRSRSGTPAKKKSNGNAN